jgi:16S rRNA processing protein RimM
LIGFPLIKKKSEFMSLTDSEWIEIGTIVAPQGLKGEMRVNPDSDFPERFEQPGDRWLQFNSDSDPQRIELLRGYQIPGKNLYVIKLAGIDDRDHAEKLRGCKLLVPDSDRPILPEGEYHVKDLMGLEVYLQTTGEMIGVVVDLFKAGNDLLEVQLNSNLSHLTAKPKTVLIPFVTEIVPLINLEQKRLEINPPAGLLEI